MLLLRSDGQRSSLRNSFERIMLSTLRRIMPAIPSIPVPNSNNDEGSGIRVPSENFNHGSTKLTLLLDESVAGGLDGRRKSASAVSITPVDSWRDK